MDIQVSDTVQVPKTSMHGEWLSGQWPGMSPLSLISSLIILLLVSQGIFSTAHRGTAYFHVGPILHHLSDKALQQTRFRSGSTYLPSSQTVSSGSNSRSPSDLFLCLPISFPKYLPWRFSVNFLPPHLNCIPIPSRPPVHISLSWH